MTDLRLHHTDDGGEIDVVGGRVTMDDGLETAAYISLFGGNELDAGQDSTAGKTWWGNVDEEDRTRRLVSETQHLLRALPATAANLRRIEDAAVRDLAWMVDAGAADAVEVTAFLPARNTVRLVGSITVDGAVFPFDFQRQWLASA
jgi:phage gp46-like protein